MKKTLYIVALCLISKINAQEVQKKEEISSNGIASRTASTISGTAPVENVLPKDSPFQLGGNTEGLIQNSINKTTGKVVFSVPIASVSANTVAHGISFMYNGRTAFKEAKNTNKFNPTGTLGVGFSMNVPKIVVDHKNTVAIDDDTFYLLDGNNTKLICTNKTDTYLEFQPEKYAPWKIKYMLQDNYWEMVKEDGKIYQFGAVPSDGVLRTNAKSFISTWGNWIGDSNQNPTDVLTTEWSIYKIKDQWDNHITFTYEKVNGKQNSSQPNNFHTEAMYLKEIKASNNTKVTFEYGNKIPQEYYEPHTEQPEPDAYQEKYEKKYLQNIKTYNSENELVFTYTLDYNVLESSDPTRPYRAKRYLHKITQEDKNGNSLPSQQFEYHTSGDFKGGINKIIYPTGGEVTYNYKKQTLFYNGANRFSGAQPNLSDYYLKATYNEGNYVLSLYRSKNEVLSGKYSYKIIRHFWNGTEWDVNEFTLPHYLPYQSCIDLGGGDCFTRYLDGFKVVYGSDYYGFMYFNRAGQSANIYLFHLNNDRKTWNYYTRYIPSVESKNHAPYNEDPAFLNGDKFVAIGTVRTGELRTYTWNGTSWNYNMIDQKNGSEFYLYEHYYEFYYYARNNFIISLNINKNENRPYHNLLDVYRFHYLDIEKKWNTKNWTEFAQEHINNIGASSNFYSSNSLTSFVPDNNPEYFLRWNANYDLTNIDNVLGVYNDATPLYNNSTGMFAVDNSYSDYGYLYKTARFNGVSWSTHLNYNYGDRTKSVANGSDMLFYQFPTNANFTTYQNLRASLFNANTNSWITDDFMRATSNTYSFSSKTSTLNDFLFAYNRIYKKTENPFSPTTGSFNFYGTVPFNVEFSNTNGLNYAYLTSIDGFLHFNPNFISNTIYSSLYFINKQNDGVSFKTINNKFGLKGLKEFGGYYQFLSGNTIYLRNKGSFSNNEDSFDTYLYRIIDDKIEENITDVVVDNINIDNKQDSPRIIDYVFEDFHISPDESVHYGIATTQHKGYGSGNTGRVIDYFNNGSSDIRLIGMPTKMEIKDANNDLKSESIFTTNTYDKLYYNNSNTLVGKGSYVRNTKKVKNLVLSNGLVRTAELFEYNNLGLISKKILSYGGIEDKIETSIEYANEIFSFLNDKNIVSQPAKIVEKKDNQIIGVSETKWKHENHKMYPYQTLAGVSKTKLLTEITRVNNLGLVEEETNGKGIYEVTLFGYNYKYPIAKITNVRYNSVISQLDVSYNAIQELNNSSLELELIKLYSKLPNANITLSFYDDNGNLISQIDSRKEKVTYSYDDFNRLINTKDSQGNKLSETEYNFKQ